jgi:hypothetical protein
LLRDLRPHEVANRSAFYSRLQQAAGGGLIGGPIEQVRWLRDEFDREARASLVHARPADQLLRGMPGAQSPERLRDLAAECTPPHKPQVQQPEARPAKVGDPEARQPEARPAKVDETEVRRAVKWGSTDRELRVGLTDGGGWFKQTLVVALRKYTGAALDGSEDATKIPRIVWVENPRGSERLDLLLFSQHGGEDRHRQFKCAKLCVTGECDWPGFPKPYDADVMIATVKTPGVIYVPFCITSFWERRWHALRHLTYKPASPPSEAQKPRFCAFFFHNCVPNREALFDRVSTYKAVDALGRSKSRDPQSYKSPDRFVDPAGATLYDTATVRYLPYKFAFANEPAEREGWVTEKLVNAMLAGAIPIYRGAPDIGQFFNSSSFICGNGLSDDDVVERVRRVDQSAEEYRSMWAQPWISENQLRTWFTSSLPKPLEDLISRIRDASPDP